MKLKGLLGVLLLLFFLTNTNSLFAQPPGGPPPGGSPAAGTTPPCWNPPCIPIDGGVGLLLAAGAIIGTRQLYRIKKA